MKTKIIDFFSFFLLKILFIFIKKNNKVLLFGDFSGIRFGDNCKYLYLYLYEKKSKYNLEHIIWITKNKDIFTELKNKGYEVYYKYSLKSIYWHLKAKYHFVDQGEGDILGYFSRAAIRINLWHGFPLKKIKSFCGEMTKNVGGWEYQYLLTCSDFGDETLGKAFQITKDRMIKGLYPRVDSLKRNNYPIFNQEKKYLEKIWNLKLEGKKILIYLPTFRDKNKLRFLGATKNEIKNFFSFLKSNNYFLISKVHLAGVLSQSNLEEEIIDIENEEIFINLKANVDIYPILKEVDILITDYSSVYFDYLALDKDVIFYPYDLEMYDNVDRGLLFNYNEMTPGDKVYNISELIENLKIKKIKRDNYEKDRKLLLEKCFRNYTLEDTVKNILDLKGNNGF